MHDLACLLALQGGRDAQGKAHGGGRPQHIAGIGDGRHAFGPGHGKLRAPAPVQDQFDGIVAERLHAGYEGKLGIKLIAQRARRSPCLGDALGRHLDVKGLGANGPGVFVLQARDDLAQQAKARGHRAGGIARMHALAQDPHRQIAGEGAAQRGRDPELVVIAAARIEAHHKRGVADALSEMLDVEGQIVAAGFLTRLDENDAARMEEALVGERQDRRQRGEDGIAIVGTAPAVELVGLQPRNPGPIALEPARHLRLLVEMAVEEDRAILPALAQSGSGCRHLDDDDRRAPGKMHHLQLRAAQARKIRLGPAGEEIDGLVHESMGRPIAIEGRGFVGDADVVDQGGDDLLGPAALDELHQSGLVHCLFRIHRH